MTKLCPRGKAAAKRKFKVYPSAYANAYASKICAGKIKDPSGTKRKDFKGPKPAALGSLISTGARVIGKYLAKRKAKKTEKSFFKQLKDQGYENNPAKQTRKNKMSAIVGKTSKQKKPELDDKLGAAIGPTYVGSSIVAVKGKEFADQISEDIASGKARLREGKKKNTATFMRKSKKYQQKTANYNYGGQVGNHSVMGSPISVDVDDDNLSNSSAMAYYKDLL